jgi:cell wall-associated NlpC family hydrolase
MVQKKLVRTVVWSLSATLGMSSAAIGIDALLAPLAGAQPVLSADSPAPADSSSTTSTTSSTSSTSTTSTTSTTLPVGTTTTPVIPKYEAPPSTTTPRVPLSTPTTTVPPSTTTTTPPPTTTVPPAPAPPPDSEVSSPLAALWLAKADGSVSEVGSATPLATSTAKLSGPVVAMASTPDGGGYWLVDAAGQVAAAGDAASYGDAPGLGLALNDVVGIAATTDGKGYWLVDSRGGILAFGDAVGYGSMAGQTLAKPVVGITATPDGKGYWEVAADGGVFAFGDAPFLGSDAGTASTNDVVALTSTLDGQGYWLLGADGAVYTYGDGHFAGALTDQYPSTKFVGFTPSLDGQGYWLTAADGTVVALGDAQPATGATAGDAGTTTPSATTTTATTPATEAATTTPIFTSTVIAAPASATGSTAGTVPATLPVVTVAPANRLVPASYVAWDVAAAASCPGLPWTVLAGIGSVETDFGRSTLPGVSSGANSAGAEGPMQFLPATFAAYDHPINADETATPSTGVTPPSPYDPLDAIWAAARLLCSNGGTTTSGLSGAIYSYNHSSSYVATVEALAATYSGSGTATPAALTAVHSSLSQLGVPYVWGGETPGIAFDCSGLVQWAYRSAGITIPRTTQTQWAELPHLSPTTPLEPGDLVYYGPDSGPTHVGMYLGDGRMIDAPYTGVDVRIDPVDTGENYVGAIRPSDLGPASTGTSTAPAEQ